MDEVYQLTQDGVSRLEQPLPGQPGALCLLRCHSPVLEQRAGSADTWREGSGRTCLSGLLCSALSRVRTIRQFTGLPAAAERGDVASPGYSLQQ